MYTHIIVFIFFMFSLCAKPYHVRSASVRGERKRHIASCIHIRIDEKDTEHFLRISGFKPNARRTQIIFHIRFESIKLKGERDLPEGSKTNLTVLSEISIRNQCHSSLGRSSQIGKKTRLLKKKQNPGPYRFLHTTDKQRKLILQ